LYVFFVRERTDPRLAELEQALTQKPATLTAEVLTKLAPATMATTGGDKLTRAGAMGAILKLRHE
jgi:hypothetical protein